VPPPGDPEPPRDEPVAEVVGHYRLGRVLGRGGMGVVYEAEDLRLGRGVALKFLSPHLHTDPHAKERFLREARTVSALDHPNVCTLFEADETPDGRVFIAMARYAGETLADRIARGPLPVEEAADLGLQIARGLCAAHRQDIIHRDLKPDNVFVTGDGIVKILDFGIAKVAGSALTQTGYALGTAAYAAPEQTRAEGDHRVDLWALGVVLYEMLAGERPFRAEYAAALLYAIVHEEHTPLIRLRPDVPPALAEVVERCLCKDPAARYASAEEAVEALEPLTRTGGGAAALGKPQGWLVGGGVLAMLLLAAVSLFPGLRASGELFAAEPGVRHLAVLPLTESGAESEFARGLTTALAVALTQLGPYAADSVRVVPAAETDGLHSVRQARERFGAGEAVTGEVRFEEGRVRVALTLRETRRDRPVRTHHLDLPAHEAASLQAGLVEAAAALLTVPLPPAVRLALTAGGTSDPEAYAFYTKGQGALIRYDQAEQVATAAQLFEWAIEEDPEYALAHAGLCEAELYRYRLTVEPARVEAAETHCYRALALDDRLAPVHATLGRLLVERGRYDDAIQRFRLALVLDSLRADTHDGLGQALQLASRPREAEAAFRRALALAPRAWSYHNNLGSFYLQTGRFEDALQQFEAVVRAVPDHAWGHSNLGAAHLYRSQIPEAKAAFERANAIQPTAFAYSNLGVIAFFEERLADEVRMYERALNLLPGDYLVWGNLGSAYSRAGDPDRAAGAYARAAALVEARLAVNPQHAERLVDLADYSQKLRQPERARAALEQALRLAPENVILAGRAASVYAGLGDREAAVRIAERAIAGGYPRASLEADTALARLLQPIP